MIEQTAAAGCRLPLVTVAIPVYRRLHLLEGALHSVAAQDYPNIELIVSDNGTNGDAVRQLVTTHYPRAHTFRQNPTSVPVVDHLNQLLAAASGEYFVLLCDDDEVSPRFVSDLVSRLECEPHAHVGVARAATMDADGANRRSFEGEWPERLSAADFIRGWTTKSIRLVSTVTHMSRTASARACGGYADFPRALYSDNLFLLKLALLGDVVLSQHSTFTWRIDDTSTGYSASYQEVARSCRMFLRQLESDRQINAFAARQPAWPELRALLRQQCGSWYFFRWRDRYRSRLTTLAWLRAACAMPYLPSYYGMVYEALLQDAKARVRQSFPAVAQ